MKDKKVTFKAFRRRAGFTLAEVLVACAILSIIVMFASQMVSSTNQSVKNGRKVMDADNMARLVFDRMSIDLSKISRNAATDFYFYKKPGNDKMYFFSEAPASFDLNNTEKNPISLIGYQINDKYEAKPPITGLMRLGKGLSWESSGSSSAPSIIFLTFPAGSYEPDPLSTIEGNNGTGAWPGAISNNSTDPNQHLLGGQVFRFEYYFLLKNGTHSTKPIINTTSPKCEFSAAAPPKISDDHTKGYGAGSRWWDESNTRGYICKHAGTGKAIWKPLGIDDVSAIIVNLAILDKSSTLLINNMKQLSQSFGDAVESRLNADPPILMMEDWNKALNSIIANPSASIPKIATGQIRLYQRVFNISNQN